MGTMVSINPEDGEKVILKFKGQTAYNQFHKGQRCTGHSNGPVKATVIKPIDSLFSSSNLK
jgi:hypothetical protein